jgi:nicotinate-nucleotide--dimethylbenzimidazole phosphoribosyltransferase
MTAEENLLRRTITHVPTLDAAAMSAARDRLDQLTKPRGSLGRLETIAVQLAGITAQPRPRFAQKAVLILAADHGVAAEGVSAYPQAVTAQMVMNFLAGGAAINVLARGAGARVVVADLGVAATLPASAELIARKVGFGTANLAVGPAMSRREALTAITAGIDVVQDEIDRGLDLLALGEMGIGNTTAASAIIATMTGRPAFEVTGRGTGLSMDRWRWKVSVVERALARNHPDRNDPLDVLAKVGGYEIAGLVGAILAAAARRVPVLLDGFIAGAAALLVAGLCPASREFLLAAHRSAENGHQYSLAALELCPLLDLELRLGEGTGAVLAMHLVDAAAAILAEMATFAEAGVAEKEQPQAAQAQPN